MKMKIKTGDQVKIIAGKDKGKTGKIIQVFPKENRVVVEGANMLKKHVRSMKQGQPGQRVEFAAPLHASNVVLVEKEAAVASEEKKVAKPKATKKATAKK
ncbi:MAG: 50S ribosomal protein L24 [Patescibacteria group bacterium]